MANIPGDDFPTITLSLLRSLIVNRIDYHIVRLLSFLDVPSLEHLTMDMVHSYEANGTILWTSVHNFLQGNPPSLRHLTLRYMVLGCSFVDILSTLSGLEYLKFDRCQMDDELVASISGDDFPIISLSLLRSLIIRGIGCAIRQLLSVIDVSSLQRLTVDLGEDSRADDTLWASLAVPCLLRRDPLPLKELTLQSITVLGGSFVSFVSRLSCLEYLTFDGCEVEDEILTAFILDSHIPHDNRVCPRLIGLTFCHTIFPGDILVKVLQSRTPLSGISREDRCLRSVEVFECPDIADHCVDLENIMEACRGKFTFSCDCVFVNA